MSDQPHKPLSPAELGDLYPKAKTYDELQAERQRATSARRKAHRVAHPIRMSILTVLALAVGMYAIVTYVVPLIGSMPLFAFPAVILLGLIWLWFAIRFIRILHAMRDQITD